MPRLQVNGEPRELPDGSTVEEVVNLVSPSRAGIAVARNGMVVPRSSWGEEGLVDGDEIEVLTAAQGG